MDVQKKFKRQASGEMKLALDMPMLRKDKTIFYADINSFPIEMDGKNYLMGTVRDVTDRMASEDKIKKIMADLESKSWGLQKANEGVKLLYKELEAKNSALQKLDQLKSDFVSTVSHELRTPLSITKEGIALVLDRIAGDVTEKQTSILTTSKDNIDRLARIIDNLLDISKIEAGKVELELEDVDLCGIIESVAESFKLKLKNINIEIKTDCPSGGVVISADKDKLHQVFTNLINNSLKFTEKGYIKTSVEEKDDFILCTVEDTGVGMTKAELPKLFDKFQQFGRVPGAGEKGTGLGLAIVKGLVELHDGKVWADSEKDKGTKVSFILPKHHLKGENNE